MEQRKLPGGTTVHFGAPANPMSKDRSRAIATVVAQIPGIVEAHLPQFFAVGDAASRQVLVVVVGKKGDAPRIAEALTVGLATTTVPNGHLLEVLPMVESPLMSSVRAAGCKIFPAAREKPWWKWW